jgi:hypothetical protein
MDNLFWPQVATVGGLVRRYLEKALSGDTWRTHLLDDDEDDTNNISLVSGLSCKGMFRVIPLSVIGRSTSGRQIYLTVPQGLKSIPRLSFCGKAEQLVV